MEEFISALGLAIVIEGILYALFPDAMKRMFIQLLEMPQSSMRLCGLLAAAIGVVIVWFVRG